MAANTPKVAPKTEKLADGKGLKLDPTLSGQPHGAPIKLAAKPDAKKIRKAAEDEAAAEDKRLAAEDGEAGRAGSGDGSAPPVAGGDTPAGGSSAAADGSATATAPAGGTAEAGGAAVAAGGTEQSFSPWLLGGLGVGGLALAGGGGGGGAAAAVAAAISDLVINATVVAGPMKAGVRVFAYDKDGNLLGSEIIGADGKCTITVAGKGNYAGTVTLVARDDNGAALNYADEATGADKDLGTSLAAVTVKPGETTVLTINITPLTDLAARKLGVDATVAAPKTAADATTIANTNTAIGNLYDVSDILGGGITTTNSAGYSTADGTTAAEKYGQALAGLSVLDTLSLGIAQTLANLAAGITVSGSSAAVTGAHGVPSAANLAAAEAARAANSELADRQITLAEAQSDGGIVVPVALPAGTVAGDLLTLFALDPRSMVLKSVTYTITAADLTAGFANVPLTAAQLASVDGLTASCRAVVTDSTGGNMSPFIELGTYGADLTAPAAPTVAALGDGQLTAAEASAASGVASVSAEAGSTVSVVLTGSAGAVTKTLTGTGSAQAVVLTAADLTTLGEGAVSVSTTATDAYGNPSAASAVGGFTLDTIAPDAPGSANTTAAASALAASELADGKITQAEAADGTSAPVALPANAVAGDVLTATIPAGSGGAAQTITYTLTAADVAAGFASVAVSAAQLVAAGDGSKAITVTFTDLAGNVGAPIAVGTVLLDVNLPVFTSAATASVAENGTAAYTALATDANGVSYTLSGADAALFTINATTGAVNFVGAPDFEAAADAGGNNVYDIVVTATDGAGQAANQAVAITVTNVNEAPTAVGSIASPTAVVNQAFTLAAATVAAAFADVDAGTTLTYSASNLPAGLSIDAATGAISGTPSAAATPTVVVTATDGGGLSVTQSFALNVVSAPVIQSIAAVQTLANAGDALTFNVVMSEAVSVSGSPTLTLDVNGQSVTATYSSGSGSNTLVFTATAPAGDGNAVSIGAASLNGGTVNGDVSGQPWVTSSVGQSTTGLTIDNTAPAFTSAAAVNLAENATGVAYTAVASEANGAVTYSLGGADAALFSIDATTGAVSINSAANFEAPGDAGANNVYDIAVTATDSQGNASVQNVAITVTNVNEAPTAVGSIAAQTAVVGQAFTLAAATVAAAFADVDAGTTLTYSASGLPAGFSIDAATGAVTGTAAAAGSQTVTVTATDGGGLAASQVFTLTEFAQPMLSSSIDNVANFEVTSNIVLTSSENVTAVAGKFIRIVNDGGAGFQGETLVHTQTIEATSGMVSIVGNKITINPGFDLDLSNNYHIEVDAGAFVGATSGQGSVAVSDAAAMNFSTVTPGTSALANAVASQKMDDGVDALVAGKKWLDIEGVGTTAAANPTSLGDLSSASYALVFKDFDPLTSDPLVGDFMATKDFWITVTGFGSDDLVYVDTQTNDGSTYDPATTPLSQAPSHAPAATEFQFTTGDASQTGVSPSSSQSWLDLTAAGNTTGFGTYGELATYLGTQPIIAG